MSYPEGVVPPVLTALKPDLSVDVESAERHMDWLVRRGVKGLFVLGTNGEGYDMNRENRRLMIRAAKNVSGGRAAVYAGCMAMGTQHMIERIREVEDLEPDAAVVMLPCYRILREAAEMEAHFLRLEKATGCRMVLYNLPQATTTSISPQVVQSLEAHERFIGIKDTSGSIRYLSEIITGNRDPARFGVLVGEPFLSAWGCLLGASGIVPSTANIDPDGAVSLCSAARGGDAPKAIEFQKRMDRVRNMTEHFGRELCMKQVLVWKGLYSHALSSSGDTIPADCARELRKTAEGLIELSGRRA